MGGGGWESWGGQSDVFLNSSNTDLAPTIAEVSILTRLPFIISCCNVPPSNAKAEEIINAQAQEAGTKDSYVYGCPPEILFCWLLEDIGKGVGGWSKV